MNFFSKKKELSRDELKSIQGGKLQAITGGDDKKCCWDDYPTSCSKCIKGGNLCTPGSHLVDC